jgi:uncharacterized SAM-binding protein YcdF (DUF218 family)
MYALLKQLLQPYTLLLLCLIAGLVRVWYRHPRPRRRLLWIAVPLLLLTLLSLPLVGYFAQGSLEWRHPPLRQRPADVEAIVVLGSYAFPANAVRPRPELDGPALARVCQAAALYHDGPPCPVLVSGGKPDPGGSEPASADVMAGLLRQMGVADGDLIVENASRDTFENAQNSAALLNRRGLKRVALVTDAGHLPRAVACFRKQGLDVVPAGCSYRAIAYEFRADSVLPSLSGLSACHHAAYEWLSLAWYRLRGRI